jgi:tRNA(Arg) A34 adenosine deaminase TadA
MQRAIELARLARLAPFGAVIVEQAAARIVAEGFNRCAENPAWHGEMDAINHCARSHAGIDWALLTLYTTAEPCPMCQAAILWAGIPRVVYGSSITFLKSRGWWQIDIPSAEVVRRTPFRVCTLIGGVLEEECNALFENPPARYCGDGK